MNGRKRKVHRNHLTRHLLAILASISTTRPAHLASRSFAPSPELHRAALDNISRGFPAPFLAPLDTAERNAGEKPKRALGRETAVLERINRIQ